MLYDANAKPAEAGFNPNTDNGRHEAKTSGVGKFMFYFFCVITLGLFFIYKVTKGNWYNAQQMKANEAASNIDVQLAKRRDTLVKLLDATKGYMKYEKELLTDVTRLRNINVSPQNRNEVSGQMNSAFSRLMMSVENYPDLKANESVQELMNSAEYIEKEIAATRRLYNSTVVIFNQTMFQWPANVVASGMHLSTLPMFQASAIQKKDVKLDL